LAIDVVDKSYGQYPNNQFLTSDWNKPINERNPSEYRKRYSEDDVRKTAEKSRLKIVAINKPPENSFVPRAIYILQK
jgi:hypothetical protein